MLEFSKRRVIVTGMTMENQIVPVRLEVMDADGGPMLRVSGRLDAANAPAFGAALLPLLAEVKTTPVLDLSGVEYISSSGLRVLLQAAKQLQPRGCRLTLTRVPASVYAVLTLSGFATFMTIQQQE